LTTRTVLPDSGPLAEPAQAVGESYVRAIERAGGVPVFLPSNLGPEAAVEIAGRLQGILLTGGRDVDPVHFGEEPKRGLGVIEPIRDVLEIALCRFAEEADLPLLGICRGIQVLNVAFGGGVIQDLEGSGGEYLNHDLTTYQDGPGHSVEILPETKLREILGADRLRVNSHHHQIVGDVAASLTVNARAPDGAIEGLEHPGRQFMIGVQWHPERSYRRQPHAAALLTAFVRACEE
jgi:putative glutamine amidotransferase